MAAVTVFNFLFVPPRWTFEVVSREHLIALFTMLAVSLVISQLAAALRRDAAVLGPGTGRWPGLNAWFLPLGDKHRMNGAPCIQNVSADDADGLKHGQALCALLAQAL